jgi:two-component system, chemotaxis family, protein-glutamate methylesterase/glutaminase
LKKINVLVVDDSEYNREVMTRMLESSSRIKVAGTAADGEEAIERVVRLKPDFITLDLEMPKMDGFTFLRWLMRSMPLPVVVVSSKADDKSVIRALEFGAVDFLPKPIGPESSMEDLKSELVKKVLAFADTEMTKVRTSVALIEEAARLGPEKMQKRPGQPVASEYDVLAIGASTGGPPAIQAIVTVLPKNFPLPIIVSQHMPAKFTRFFAERLDKLSQLKVKEAAEGDLVTPGRVFIAPGGMHMSLGRTKGGVEVELKKPDGKDKYVPSVDVMMRSAAMNYGGRVLGVILTGMGNDGKEGMQMIKGMGGRTFAESQETAVIFGMPKEAVMAGAVDRVVPLGSMASEILAASGMKK